MIHDMIMAAAGAAGPSGPTDADFENVTLLLHGDGTNGAQNNTFLDSSTNNFTITRNGNTTQGSFSPFSKPDGRWGNYFDGTGDYLTFTGNSSTNFSGNDWCVETWFYMTKTPSTLSPLVISTTGTNNWIPYLGLAINSNLTIYAAINAAGYNSSQTVSLNTWNHIAMVRSGGVVKVYLNGTATSISVTADINNSNLSFWIAFVGPPAGVTEQFGGYLSNLRMVDGSAVYTSNFTPPTAPLTAIANTSLLTCQSNRFKDNSSNNFAITRNGDVKVTPFSPFPTLTAYDAATNGGSGYFDGSGDYLTVPDNAALDFGTGDFTIQFWVWFAATPTGDVVLLEKRPSLSAVPWIITADATSGGTVYFYDGTVRRSSIAITPRAWQHYAFTRSSGTLKIFVNGVEGFSGSVTTNLDSAGQLVIAARADFGVPFTGYMSGLQLLKGTGYTSFSIPTAPPTAIANTSLLCNFTNAGIFDNTGFNNLETVGNAQIDTSVKKYGTGAMEFDGTGDWLIMKDTPEMVFGTGDFTIEFWVNTNQTANEFAIIDFRTANGAFPFIAHDSTRGVFYYLNTNYRIEANTVLTTGVWYHIAVARSGSSTKLFINGTQAGSTFTDSTSLSVGANRPIIGTNGANVGTLPLNGYIDDLRITKGIARYTANFTPPTAALPDIGT